MYQLTQDESMVIWHEGDVMTFITVGSLDYQRFLDWCAAGNVPEPADK